MNKELSGELFIKKYVFGPNPGEDGYIRVNNDSMYTPEIGYGFVDEKVKAENELIQIMELGNGFSISPDFEGQVLTNILMENRGGEDNLRRSFCYSDRPDVPLYFRVKVPHNGNYNVNLIMGDKNADTNVTVFSERRRCVLQNATAKAGKFIELEFTANVCDIVPRGKEGVYPDDSIDITIVGNKSCINAMTIEEVRDVPTIYIAGDSTLTDQAAEYPYNPAKSYCGWAQMFPLFFKSGIAISNQAHSGLTTASFRNGGHYEIVEKRIKPNDFFFMQFGHNDQKDIHLSAFEGYANNLRRYVDEVRAKGAFPVIITPVSRTLWNGEGGSFNDLLADNAEACIQVAKEMGVQLIDLHEKSVEFILKYGPKESTKFFFPKDYTHHNDFGAYEMAKFIVEGIKEANIKPIVNYLRDEVGEPLDMSKYLEAVPTANNVQQVQYTGQKLQTNVVPKYEDIQNHFAKADIEEMLKRGIIKGKGDKFLPENNVTRVEFLSILFKAVRYLPANVYDDMYSDVFGDEWYAGTIQAAYNNGLIDGAITPDKEFKPEQFITCEESITIIINAYKNKKNIKNIAENRQVVINTENISSWAQRYIKDAYELEIIKENAKPEIQFKKAVTRAQLAVMMRRLADKI